MRINNTLVFTSKIDEGSVSNTNLSPKYFPGGFAVSPVFKGSSYPSGYYTDKEITDTYRYLNRPDDTSRPS